MKDKNPFEFKSITEMIDLIGLIETGAFYFKPEKKGCPISTKDMEEILYHFSGGNEKSDWGRTIRNAREFFNHADKEF